MCLPELPGCCLSSHGCLWTRCERPVCCHEMSWVMSVCELDVIVLFAVMKCPESCLWIRCERPVCCHEMSSPFGVCCPLVVAIKCHFVAIKLWLFPSDVLVAIKCHVCCRLMSSPLPSTVASIATKCHVCCHQMSCMLPLILCSPGSCPLSRTVLSEVPWIILSVTLNRFLSPVLTWTILSCLMSWTVLFHVVNVNVMNCPD